MTRLAQYCIVPVRRTEGTVAETAMAEVVEIAAAAVAVAVAVAGERPILLKSPAGTAIHYSVWAALDSPAVPHIRTHILVKSQTDSYPLVSLPPS